MDAKSKCKKGLSNPTKNTCRNCSFWECQFNNFRNSSEEISNINTENIKSQTTNLSKIIQYNIEITMKKEERAKQAIVADIANRGNKGLPLSKDEQLLYETHKRVVKEDNSWLYRNAWWIVVGIVLFAIRMIHVLSK